MRLASEPVSRWMMPPAFSRAERGAHDVVEREDGAGVERHVGREGASPLPEKNVEVRRLRRDRS